MEKITKVLSSTAHRLMTGVLRKGNERKNKYVMVPREHPRLFYGPLGTTVLHLLAFLRIVFSPTAVPKLLRAKHW